MHLLGEAQLVISSRDLQTHTVIDPDQTEDLHLILIALFVVKQLKFTFGVLLLVERIVVVVQC